MASLAYYLSGFHMSNLAMIAAYVWIRYTWSPTQLYQTDVLGSDRETQIFVLLGTVLLLKYYRRHVETRPPS